MSGIPVVARGEVRSASRERLALALLVVFLGMVLVSAAIGWATHHTVKSVYDETVLEMGRDVPNPFTGASPLEIIKNTVIYIVLIGALLAVVVGVRSSIRDRKAGVADLILSRPIGTRSYLAGKLLGIQIWTGIVLLISLVASWFSVWVISGLPLSLSDTALLFALFALAWVFLLPFSVIGMIAGARSRHESTALLVPVLLWVGVVFVIPQLGTAQNPVALLNPVPAPISSTDLFFRVNRIILQPISITEHFKHLSGVILHLRDITATAVRGDLLSIGLIALLSLAALALVTRSSMRRPVYE
jgi:ABC-2 type transport system permease protein